MLVLSIIIRSFERVPDLDDRLQRILTVLSCPTYRGCERLGCYPALL